MFDTIDFNTWPVWLIAVLVLLNLFKEPLSEMFGGTFKFLQHRQRASDEFGQEIQETLLNSKLQTAATEQLSVHWLQEKIVDLLEANLEWMRTHFDDLSRAQAAQLDELAKKITIVSGQVEMNTTLLKQFVRSLEEDGK